MMGFYGASGRDSWAAQPDSRGLSVGERIGKVRNAEDEIRVRGKRKKKDKKPKGANP